jgi:hypothetical protein
MGGQFPSGCMFVRLIHLLTLLHQTSEYNAQ